MPRKKKIHYIYKIHFLCGFPTGRYYIGKHTGQVYDSYAGSGNFCTAYYKKYGKIAGETYIKEILEINPNKKINKEREKVIIGDLWKTDPLCKNQKPGGEGGGVKGFKLSDEHKAKLIAANTGNRYLVSCSHFKEIRKKAGLSIRKPIVQYDLNGNKIREFSGAVEAAEVLGEQVSNISECCKRKRKTCGKYIFRYKSENIDKVTDVDLTPIRPRKRIRKYTMDWDFICEYPSLTEAAIDVATEKAVFNISNCCAGKKNSAYGFKWKYVEENDKCLN